MAVIEHGRLAGIYILVSWKNESFSGTVCFWSYDMPNARVNVRIIMSYCDPSVGNWKIVVLKFQRV